MGGLLQSGGEKSREKRKAGAYSRWRRSAPDAYLRRGSLRRGTGLSPAGARLRRPPNLRLRPARPWRSAGVRGRTARVRKAAARLGTVRYGSAWHGSRRPGLAARLCPRYLQLPEKLQRNISPCICGWHFFFFPRSLKPVYPKTHGLLSFCQHVILPSS